MHGQRASTLVTILLAVYFARDPVLLPTTIPIKICYVTRTCDKTLYDSITSSIKKYRRNQIVLIKKHDYIIIHDYMRLRSR